VLKREHCDSIALPRDLDYCTVRGLSKEVQQKLNQHKPETIGQASRISGLTPAAISLLLVHLKRGFESRNMLGSASAHTKPTLGHEALDDIFSDDFRKKRPAA
jgi:tRNA uridine 5-carboxymethylaminomethyl modification enzyme